MIIALKNRTFIKKNFNYIRRVLINRHYYYQKFYKQSDRREILINKKYIHSKYNYNEIQ